MTTDVQAPTGNAKQRLAEIDLRALTAAFDKWAQAPAWGKTQPLMALVDVVGPLDAWENVDELLTDVAWLVGERGRSGA